MGDVKLSLSEFFDQALQEIYSLEEMLGTFGQRQMADVLRSVVEMSYSKLRALDEVMERDVGLVQVQANEFGEPTRAVLAVKPKNESIQ